MSLFEPPLNFLRIDEKYSKLNDSYFVIMPVGYDATTSYLTGTRRGPLSIIEASINLEWYDMELDNEPYLEGIHTLNFVETDASSAENMYKRVLEAARQVISKERFFIEIGGEHSVSLGFIQAHKELYGDFTVIHFDAHADVREEYEGCEYSHACVMGNLYKRGVCNIVQFGIRSMDRDEKDFLQNSDITTITALDIHNDLNTSIKRLLEGIKHEKVYISFDIDVFDPSLVWDTGTPEPGGLLWYDIMKTLKAIFEKHEVIGCDVVELRGNEPSNASTVAKLIYKIMGYKTWQKNLR